MNPILCEFAVLGLAYSSLVSDPRFRQKWSDKAQAVQSVLAHFKVAPSDIAGTYNGQVFQDGASKLVAFSEVISGAPTKDTIDYLDQRCTEGFGHLRGDRSGAEYGADLILGWVVEDGFKLWAERSDLIAENTGHDRSREFLRPGKISAASDFKIGVEQPRRMELATDYKGHWKKTNKWDMRDSKFQKLVAEQALVFLIDVLQMKGATIDLAQKDSYEFEHIPFHFIYKKPAWALCNVRSYLAPLDYALEDLKSRVK